MRKDRVDKFVEEYEARKNTYQAFVLAIKAILEILLKNNGFQYQISARDKSPESLRKKLSEDNLPQIDTVTDVQDLAACRVLFYLETDIERFARHIYDEFELLKRDDRYSSDDYNAVHLVTKLKEARTALPEYAQFAGMICEIQLTTILYHAWSEMAHDIIYKPPLGLREFDEHAYETLRKRFKSVMEDYIKKASYDFEFIYKQFEKIKEGKRVFDSDFLTIVERSTSNNEIYQNLKLLAQYVEEFGDKTPQELSIIVLIRKVLEKLSTLKREPIKTAIGELEGYDVLDVVKVCLEILNMLTYQYPDETFDILVHLSKSSEPEIRKQALVALERLAQYNFHILKQAGYAFQKLILGKIEHWSEPQLRENLDALLFIGQELLKPSFEGTSSQDYKTITFTSGPLVVNDNLREVRAKTIELLRKMLHLSGDSDTKNRILHSVNEAVRTPHQGSNPELNELILNDSNKVIDIYIEIAADQETNGHVLATVEEQTRWLIHRFGFQNLPNVGKLESLLRSNEEYQIFRALVGYDGRLAPDFDFEADRAEREKKIEDFLMEVKRETFPLWGSRILTIVKSYEESDPGKYQYFTRFLNKLSEQEPSLTLAFLEQHENELRPVLLSILSGIWKSSAKNRAKDTILQWVKAGKYLPECARIFALVAAIDQRLLDAIFGKAVEMGDVGALNSLIDSIAENYPPYKQAPFAFVKVVQQLTRHHDTRWINYVWYRKESIIAALSESEIHVIMENLLWLPNVDYHAESVLKVIAEKYPLKIVEWFHARIGIELQERKASMTRTYDAIPFELHLLREALIKYEETIILEVLKWYRNGGEENNRRYRLEASRFLKIIFPNGGNTLETQLISSIEERGTEAVDDIFHLLRQYQGESFLWNICKAIIKKPAPDEKYSEMKSKLFSILSGTGMVSGEYGFAEAYEKKREELKSWPDDNLPVLKAFLKDYDVHLQKLVIYARKTADEDIQSRKREFEG